MIYQQLHDEIDHLRAQLKNQTAKLDKLVNQISSQVMKIAEVIACVLM